MKASEKKHLLKWNTILWIAAMVMPAVFSIALGSTKFPWPMILPFLFIGFMLASNKMLSSAMEEPGETTKPG
jgi:fatty acid desaturase